MSPFLSANAEGNGYIDFTLKHRAANGPDRFATASTSMVSGAWHIRPDP